MATKSKTKKPVEEVVEEISTNEVDTPEYEIGKIINCTGLRIRKSPSPDADIVTVIDAGKNLEFKKSDVNGWYAVKFEKFSGFAMADFID